MGYLLSLGVIKSIEEIQKIAIRKGNICHVSLKPTVNLPTSEGKQRNGTQEACPKIVSKLAVKAEIIQKSVENLNRIAEIFIKTGGAHAAAIYNHEGALLAFSEDVSRHYAVDKAIGEGALKKTDFSECFLALSGRLTGDIALKAATVGIPILASLAAATTSGIAMAKKTRLTLVGFVRGKNMNIYSFPERILS